MTTPSMSQEFAKVYEAEFTAVWRFLHRLGARGSTLDDLVHDVFVLAWRRFDAFDSTRPARPWLFGIAFRVASDFRALARHTHEVLDGDETDEPTQLTPEAALEARDARKLVSAGLSSLPLDLRAVFVMHELEERPIPEVAAAMGVPVPTTYTRLRRARQLFGEAVSARQQGGPRE